MATNGSDKSGKKSSVNWLNKTSNIKESFNERVSKTQDSIKNIDANSVKETVIRAPNKIRRSLSGISATQALVKFPIVIIVLCLITTGFFTLHSGAIDCREGFENSICKEESSMNVNGDLEVYLPEGSEVSLLIEEVELNWTTNVMIIYGISL